MISSTSNAKVKNIINLKKSARARKKENCFLVEGPRMFFEIPKDRIAECYLTEEFADKYAEELKGWRYELMSENVCRHLSDTKTPQGVIAVVRREEPSVEELLNKEKNPCFFLLENLQDPGNLGTIIRTAEGAGVTGVIMNRDTVDIYNPKVIRSTMGSAFRVNHWICDDIFKLLNDFKLNKITTYSAIIDSSNYIKDEKFLGGSAVVVGNEGNGLPSDVANFCDKPITIEMSGNINSLNVAMASGIIMWKMSSSYEC